MTMKFCAFASGSSGNCYMIKDNDTAILIDAGISGKRILEALDATETPKDDVAAILVTHEHIDHVKSLPVMTKKIPGLQVFANEETWDSIERPVADERKKYFAVGEDFKIGNFAVKPFAVPHDAANPVGFTITKGGKQITICTDVGYISEEIHEEIKGADLLLLEANHEEELLMFGGYPYHLKQRILGDHGHLSNISCGESLCRIITENPKKRTVILGHLSHENNTPALALQAVKNTLENENIFLGDDLKLEVASRKEISKVFEL